MNALTSAIVVVVGLGALCLWATLKERDLENRSKTKKRRIGNQSGTR